MLAGLRADCHSPVAALAVVGGETLVLRAQLLTPDGVEAVEGTAEGADPVLLGARLAEELLERAPPAIRVLFG